MNDSSQPSVARPSQPVSAQDDDLRPTRHNETMVGATPDPRQKPVKVQRAVVITLDPTSRQVPDLISNCGAARFAYNTMLARVKANLDQRTAEKTYGLEESELTPALSWSKFSLDKAWNAEKVHAAPWWRDNSALAYRHGTFSLGNALEAFMRSRAGVRKGHKVGFPRFKSRSGSRMSVKFEHASIKLDHDGKGVRLPRIGRVHTLQSTKAIKQLLASRRGKLNSVTVSFVRGRWQASFQIEAPAPAHRQQTRADGTVGIDVGVKDLIVVATPDGREVERLPAPRDLSKALGEIKRLQRQAARQVGPYDLATRQQQTPSAGWRRTQAKVAKLHARVANLRRDRFHKLTTRLALSYETIVLETLNVQGMTRKARPKPDPVKPGAFLPNGRAAKRGLSRSIADASFGELHRQLDYKASWYGANLVRADRFYPSSKTCSRCGAAKTKLSLSDRVYECTTCGKRLDRDLNAAINLARLGKAKAPLSAPPVGGRPIVSGRDPIARRTSVSVNTAVGLGSRNPNRTTGTLTP